MATAAVGVGALGAILFIRLQAPVEKPLAVRAPRPDWALQLPQSIDAITAALARLPLPLPPPEERARGAGRTRWSQRHYEVRMNAPEEPELLRRWFDEVEQAAPAVGATIQQDANGAEVQIGVDGLLTHTLSLHWHGRHPRVAFLLTGFGADLRVARDVASLGLPIGLAIDPSTPFAPQVAELARLAGLEVILQMTTSAAEDPDAESETAETGWTSGLDRLGNAIGIYVESTVASEPSAAALHGMLPTMSARGLFLIDAGDQGPGQLCHDARQETVSCVRRDVRLDTEENTASIQLQIESAMTLVRTRGNVVVVGRASPATLAALHHLLPSLRAGRVEIAPLSVVVADRRALSTP